MAWQCRASTHIYECEIGLKLNLIVNTNNYIYICIPTYSNGMCNTSRLMLSKYLRCSSGVYSREW